MMYFFLVVKKVDKTGLIHWLSALKSVQIGIQAVAVFKNSTPYGALAR
jgi:hypothetical protein